jgi:hypothetical protein
MYTGPRVKHPLFLSDYSETIIFLIGIQISNFVRVCAVGTELFHVEGEADRKKDTTKQIVAFRKYTKGLMKVLKRLCLNTLVQDKIKSPTTRRHWM